MHWLREARAIEPHRVELAQRLFGWSRVRCFDSLVAIAEAGETESRFVCSIDEFETLIGLGTRGWEVPHLVSNWRTRPEVVPLGTHLVNSAAITHVDHWRPERSSRRIYEELFRGERWRAPVVSHPLMASGVVSTGLEMTLNGMVEDPSSSLTIRVDCSSTCRSASSP